MKKDKNCNKIETKLGILKAKVYMYIDYADFQNYDEYLGVNIEGKNKNSVARCTVCISYL